ncbi:16S rRNA (cytosine(967)-C(5))-methyltransferase RsmB [Candidatus Pseudomonas adelgestsugas]|uniref:16S rRNA (cytosine(967)-C(5))-methyltransferase n=1 Tax=Candidatus Pseudomonas adelgestsugas TaxID=1302376 RepID=A0ABX5RAW5_9PSED|nr:16S rRNA (cytosine(967)-C(5))-methyltransferase RsmB [Candidatus Pseudomonas adelgestsugas]QAX82308.1 Ribosomal RNA small subunit methyltransferase B [Candidatus Pseudomonas adelgestsugas]
MNPRLAAAKALATVLNGQSLLNSSLLIQLNKVEDHDRSFTKNLAFGAARWQPRLSVLSAILLRKPFKAVDADIEALLLVGLYQLIYTRVPAYAAISETVDCADKLHKPWAKALLNAVLRRAQRESVALFAERKHDPVVRTAHPRWLQKSLKKFWPEQWETICAANNEHPPMTLRVNRFHYNRDTYLKLLTDACINAMPCVYSIDGIVLESATDVSTLPGFTEGWVSVQDEAAQLAANLLDLAPHQRVLDVCCAPGGKTCHILEVEKNLASMVAIDVKAKRLVRVRENLVRLGLSAKLIAADGRDTTTWWDGKLFQRILLDAPCSSTGVIRRHPDIKLTRKPNDIATLSILQGELLDAVWPILEVGGILLYTTCSILPTENTEVIKDFLSRTQNAHELGLATTAGIKQRYGRQLLTQKGGHDGFYYAKLVKSSIVCRVN